MLLDGGGAHSAFVKRLQVTKDIVTCGTPVFELMFLTVLAPILELSHVLKRVLTKLEVFFAKTEQLILPALVCCWPHNRRPPCVRVLCCFDVRPFSGETGI